MKQKLSRSDTLKALGSSSKPFKSKFPGTCGLSGLKIKVGDEVVYYLDKLCHVVVVLHHAWFPWFPWSSPNQLSEANRNGLQQKIEANRKKNLNANLL